MAWKKTPYKKFNNQPIWVGNVYFQSKLEANHYLQLLDLLSTGAIERLELQPSYPIYVPNLETNQLMKCGEYRADFRFFDNRTNQLRVADSKGMDLALSKFKRKQVNWQYGINVEVWFKNQVI